MLEENIKGFLMLVCLIAIFFFGMAKGYNLAIGSAQLESVCENGDYYISYVDSVTGNREIYEYYGVNR